MKKIAVTGGLASGKSTVCRFLAELGAFVVSADEVVQRLLSSNLNVQSKIINLCGPDILVNDQLNKEALAKKVFSESKLLYSLESILHPLVFIEIEEQYQKVKDDPKYTLFVAEIPLLYETNKDVLFDAVVVVSAKNTLCQDRFIQKTKQDYMDFIQRTKRQMPLEEKAARAQFVLTNNGSLAELKNEVLQLTSQLQSIQKRTKETF